MKKINRVKKKNPGHKAKKINEDAQEGTYSDEDEGAACHICFRVSVTGKDPLWYTDSGATTHMCSDKKFIIYLKKVVLANGQKLLAVGLGERFIQCMRGNNEKRRIKLTADLIYVRQLHGNLISVKN